MASQSENSTAQFALLGLVGLTSAGFLGLGLWFWELPWGLVLVGCGAGLPFGMLCGMAYADTGPEGAKVPTSPIVSAPPPLPSSLRNQIPGHLSLPDDEEARANFEKQKLESLGVLAGGIAHDFNNLLTSIVGNASIAKMDIPKNHPLREPINEIATASKRAKELISQLLAYSGKGNVEVKRINLNNLVQEMAHLLHTVISKKAKLELDLTPTLCVIEADASQTRQVVMNLITNASDALNGDAGTILLKSRIVDANRRMLSETAFGANLPLGQYIQLEVSDTGMGMSEETVRRIFEPFFTTKSTGRGLGLAALIGIVRRHGGTLAVKTREGVGTTFTVMFPLADFVDGDEDLQTEDTTTGIGFAKGLGLVLLVEDEEMVRKVSARMLTKLGYQVVVAGNGREGCDKYASMVNDISVVIMDVDMPVMGGIEAMDEMMALRPDTKIILASGYTDAALGALNHQPMAFLPKPFTIKELTRCLDAALVPPAEDAEDADSA